MLRRRYYKTLGTSVINSPMSPPSLPYNTILIIHCFPRKVDGNESSESVFVAVGPTLLTTDPRFQVVKKITG